MRRLLPALLVLLALTACTHLKTLPRLKTLAPLKIEKSDEANPPLKIEACFASTPADLKPVKGWYGNESIPARLYMIAKITNNSGRLIVLPGFSRGSSGAFQFFCASSNARQPPFFLSYNGQVEWIFLKPGESVYGIDNIACYIAFLRPGHYDVEYQYAVGYTYATVLPPANQAERAKAENIYHRDHQAIARGTVDVLVSPIDVYSDKWKP